MESKLLRKQTSKEIEKYINEARRIAESGFVSRLSLSSFPSYGGMKG